MSCISLRSGKCGLSYSGRKGKRCDNFVSLHCGYYSEVKRGTRTYGKILGSCGKGWKAVDIGKMGAA